jgi:acyl-CoA thioester hydrolase
MTTLVFEAPVLWSQIDANMHLRHSAYADFAAQGRIALLNKSGFGAAQLSENNIGPILFKEELIYLREVGMNAYLKVSCELLRCRADGSRWSFTQTIYRDDGVKAAIVNTDGAWIDTEKRKLTGLPATLLSYFEGLPKSKDFILE